MTLPSDRQTKLLVRTFFLALAFLLSIPLLSIIAPGLKGFFSSIHILKTQTFTLLINSLTVTIAVTILATVLGFILAFLTVKTDLPGKKYWQIALVLPLSVPSYIGAIAYISLLAPRGLIYNWIGVDLWNIYGRDGVIFVLTLSTFSYSYLICRFRFKELGTQWEESALDLGQSPFTTLIKVMTPLCLPALANAALLIGLYTLADFGSLALLRHNTFTTAIFYQLETFDWQNAALLGFILLGITFLIVYSRDRLLIRGYGYRETWKKKKQPYLYSLGWFRWPSFLFLSATFCLSFVFPVLIMLTHFLKSQREWILLWEPLLNGFAIAFLVASIIATALPFIHYGSKIFSQDFSTKLFQRITSSLYGIPGVLTALGVLFLARDFSGELYGTLAPLALALIICFFPMAMEASRWESQSLSFKLMETSYNLGQGHLSTLRKIFIPLTKGGVYAGFLFVFVGTLKELPLQLFLRPPGFKTLSVELWVNAQEGFYDQAALYGLSIVLLTVTITPLILRRG